MVRPGRRSSARASSIASATPSAWVEEPASLAGSGTVDASKRWTVPGSAPETTVSTTIARLASIHASSSPAGSASQSSTTACVEACSRKRRATISPAASSPLNSLPTPMTTAPARENALGTLDVELEEVRRARDARVVVADRLLALPLQLVVGQVEVAGHEAAQVLLDRTLILGRGRHDASIADRAGGIDLIAMPEYPARGLADSAAHPISRLQSDGRRVGLLVGLNQA